MKRIRANLFDLLFGCWHKHLSFPLSVKRGQPRPRAAWRTGTYVVCLDCGKEFAYDWQALTVAAQDRRRGQVQHSLRSRAA